MNEDYSLEGAKAYCKNCGDVVQLVGDGMFRTCTCYRETGNLIAKYEGKFRKLLEENVSMDENSTTIVSHLFGCVLNEAMRRGFFVDYNGYYLRSGGHLDDLDLREEDPFNEVNKNEPENKE